jgi:hypothetical protein
MKAAANLSLLVGLALVVASACSDDEPRDSGTGGSSSGSGGSGEPTGGTNATGGTSGSGAAGGASGAGEGGSSGGNDPAGGGAGGQGGEGPTGDDEPTPQDVCNLLCLPDRQAGGDVCPLPPGGDGGAGGAGSGEGGAAGAGGYDRDACMQTCLAYPDINVPRQCGDESYLYWRCVLNPANWVCLETGGTEENLCDPVELQLASCVNTYS